MLLRTRILLGYGYLIGLLLLSVSVAALNSSRVAGNARQIRERNIDSLTLAVQMLEKLERQDSETLLGLLHPTQGTRLDEADLAFETALDEAYRVDSAGGNADADALTDLKAKFAAYRQVRSELLTRQHEDALAAAQEYAGDTNAAFLALKTSVDAYFAGKRDALKLANEEASRTALEGAVLLGVMVTLALLSLGFLSRSLQRDVLGRLLEVGHVTEAIAAGDRRRRVRDFYHDELGLVARQLNAALDRQHELESQMQGRLLEQRRGLVGLLNQWPTPAAMIGIDGEVVASTLTHDDEAELDRLTPRIRAAAKVLMTRRFVKAEELAVDIKASDGERLVRVRAMASGDNQISGWLATFVGEKRVTDEPTARFEGPPQSQSQAPPPLPTPPPLPAPPVIEAQETEPVRELEALREPSGLLRAAVHGSASLAPAPYEPSGLRTAGSASLAPLVREASGPRFIAPPREPSGFLRPVTLIPGGAHELPDVADEAPVGAVPGAGGASAREEVSAEMAALHALAAIPVTRTALPEPPVTRTPAPPPDTKS
jgi:HAMP domain-containing protein